MRDIPKFGVFTPTTLMIHGHSSKESPDAYLKRSAILFDHLVFIPTGLGNMGGPGEIISKQKWLTMVAARNEPAVARELEKIILLDRDVFENADAFHESLLNVDEGDLWTGPQSDKFIAFVETLVDEDPDISDKWEMKKFFIGNINADYRLFRIITERFSEYSALLSELHEQAVHATFGQGTPNPEAVLRNVADLNTFDFGQLSWENVFRLRASGFSTDFRRKVVEWIESYSVAADNTAFRLSLERSITEAKFELIGAVEPNVGATILSGIGGNLPSPIGVNPISLFGAIKDATKQHRLQKTFGWLFFIQRSRKLARDQPD